MTINPDTLKLAREWADEITVLPSPKRGAAVDVIQSLPDQWVDARYLKELLTEFKSDRMTTGGFILAVEAAIPAPVVPVEFGSFAWHPGHGKVLISSDKTDSAGDVRVHVKDPRSAVGTAPVWVSAADLKPLTETEEDGQ